MPNYIQFQKEYKTLSETDRQDVYANYFPNKQSKAYSKNTLFSRMYQCVREMYAFHEYCGRTVVKGDEDWLLSEWLVDLGKVNYVRLGIAETDRSGRTERLANMFGQYRDAVESSGE